jgi:hypothetical protein
MSDEVTGYPGAPPDWYPDPAGGPGKRWWDGYAWTDGVVLPTPQPPPPTGAPGAPGAPGTSGAGYGVPGHEMHGYGVGGYGTPWYSTAPVGNPSALLEGEQRMERLGRTAMVVIGLYYLWQYVSIRAAASGIRQLRPQIDRAIHAANNHQPAPPINFSAHVNLAVSLVSDLLGLAVIAAVVGACMWQHRAASTARALGYTAKHSPSWGVGSWFVPIVWFWMPYQAIRDCLAPGDPNRRLVKQFWFCLMGQWVFLWATIVAAFFSSGVSLALSIPGVLLALGLVTTAPRFVTAIAAAHREAVASQG